MRSNRRRFRISFGDATILPAFGTLHDRPSWRVKGFCSERPSDASERKAVEAGCEARDDSNSEAGGTTRFEAGSAARIEALDASRNQGTGRCEVGCSGTDASSRGCARRETEERVCGADGLARQGCVWA